MTILDRPDIDRRDDHGIDVLPVEQWDDGQVADIAKFRDQLAGYLAGDGPLGNDAAPKTPRFVDGTGMAINTVPPNDFGHFEMLNALVQQVPAEALDPAGQARRLAS